MPTPAFAPRPARLASCRAPHRLLVFECSTELHFSGQTGVVMLRGLLRWTSPFDDAEAVCASGGLQRRHEPSAPNVVPYPRPLPSTQSAAPKRRPQRIRVGRLYPEKLSEPQMHSRALLAFIQEECPQLVGTYVPCSDLARSYEELAATEG